MKSGFYIWDEIIQCMELSWRVTDDWKHDCHLTRGMCAHTHTHGYVGAKSLPLLTSIIMTVTIAGVSMSKHFTCLTFLSPTNKALRKMLEENQAKMLKQRLNFETWHICSKPTWHCKITRPLMQIQLRWACGDSQLGVAYWPQIMSQ